MIDHRLTTFLTLCETGSYTRTAEVLRMTQPSVTQHIQFLENHYAAALISGKGKHFSLTEEGRALEVYAKTLTANAERIKPLLTKLRKKSRPLCFGATLTIGEYMVPPILHKIIRENPERSVSMVVENTIILQKMLWEGSIDFALLEGHFNQHQFASRVLSEETFVGVSSPRFHPDNTPLSLKDLLGVKLILREQGSGTRDILEQALYNRNLSIQDFSGTIEIGNMNVIKELCHENTGITFMYREAVKKELASGYLKELPLENFTVTHPFSFVYLKDSPDEEDLEKWYQTILSLR